MSADDPVDNTALIFTEADVFMVAGCLAEMWGVAHEITDDTERAITLVLQETNA